MHDVKERLTKCFSAVFPQLSPEEIMTASPSNTGAWDSLSAVTLMALIQEEFGIEMQPDDDLENVSFQNVLARVGKAVENQTPARTYPSITNDVR